jgi:hypothetical protein
MRRNPELSGLMPGHMLFLVTTQDLWRSANRRQAWPFWWENTDQSLHQAVQRLSEGDTWQSPFPNHYIVSQGYSSDKFHHSPDWVEDGEISRQLTNFASRRRRRHPTRSDRTRTAQFEANDFDIEDINELQEEVENEEKARNMTQDAKEEAKRKSATFWIAYPNEHGELIAVTDSPLNKQFNSFAEAQATLNKYWDTFKYKNLPPSYRIYKYCVCSTVDGQLDNNGNPVITEWPIDIYLIAEIAKSFGHLIRKVKLLKNQLRVFVDFYPMDDNKSKGAHHQIERALESVPRVFAVYYTPASKDNLHRPTAMLFVDEERKQKVTKTAQFDNEIGFDLEELKEEVEREQNVKPIPPPDERITVMRMGLLLYRKQAIINLFLKHGVEIKYIRTQGEKNLLIYANTELQTNQENQLLVMFSEICNEIKQNIKVTDARMFNDYKFIHIEFSQPAICEEDLEYAIRNKHSTSKGFHKNAQFDDDFDIEELKEEVEQEEAARAEQNKEIFQVENLHGSQGEWATAINEILNREFASE